MGGVYFLKRLLGRGLVSIRRKLIILWLVIVHFPIYRSDHAPILLNSCRMRIWNVGKRPFRFEPLWLSKDECRDVVAKAWNKHVGDDFQSRIVSVSSRLVSWANSSFGEVKKKIRQVEKILAKAQRWVPHANTISVCDQLSKELDELHLLEESY